MRIKSFELSELAIRLLIVRHIKESGISHDIQVEDVTLKTSQDGIQHHDVDVTAVCGGAATYTVLPTKYEDN